MKEPSANERFAMMEMGKARDGQDLMRVAGMPSGPGAVDHFSLDMALLIRETETYGKLGIERGLGTGDGWVRWEGGEGVKKRTGNNQQKVGRIHQE